MEWTLHDDRIAVIILHRYGLSPILIFKLLQKSTGCDLCTVATKYTMRNQVLMTGKQADDLVRTRFLSDKNSSSAKAIK